MEWICRAEDLVLAEERTTEDDRKLIMEARQKAAEKMKKLSKTKSDSVESNSMEDAGEGKNLKVPLFATAQWIFSWIFASKRRHVPSKLSAVKMIFCVKLSRIVTQN